MKTILKVFAHTKCRKSFARKSRAIKFHSRRSQIIFKVTYVTPSNTS